MFFNPSEGQPLSQADVHQNFKVFRTLAQRGLPRNTELRVCSWKWRQQAQHHISAADSEPNHAGVSGIPIHDQA